MASKVGARLFGPCVFCLIYNLKSSAVGDGGHLFNWKDQVEK